MNYSEMVSFHPQQLADLQKLVRKGEGLHLEFKRKAAYPDKVICELIAFANTEGGTLLIGVDDDGTIPGVKYPEEELVVVRKSLQNHCRPALTLDETIIPISAKKFVVRLDVPVSVRKPHYFCGEGTKECYVRANDMSVKASREMTEIVRRLSKKKDIRFSFGDSEKRLMEHLEDRGTITLKEFRQVARLNRFLAAKKLVLLVLANVLKITPSEKGDVYSRT